MPDFDPQYTYGAGAISASGHAGNIASSTPEEGMYSLINGALDEDNLQGGFEFDARHFQLSEFAHFAEYKWRDSMTVYDQTVGGARTEAPSPVGVGLRYYLPSAMATVRIDYSFFLSGARAFKATRPNQTSDQWAITTDLDLYVVPYVNGAAVEGHKIQIPKNVWLGVSTNVFAGTIGSANHITSYEHLTAQQQSGTIIVNNQARGLNTFELRARLESPAGEFELTLGRKLGLVAKAENMDVILHQRLTWGAGCVTMRAMGMS